MINRIKRFCKSNKTINEKLSDLYTSFSNQNTTKYDRGDFEIGLLELGNRTTHRVKERCLKYPRDQWEKFCLEQENVTKKLWNKIHGITPKDEESIMGYFYGEKDKQTLAKKVETPVKISAKPEEKIGQIDSDCYKNLLPMEWDTLNLSDKIEFTKKVKNPGFKKFILEKEKRVAHFFDQYKEKTNKMSLYVTLFSFPSENYSYESKNLLKVFVNVLNEAGRARLQYVECNDPKTVEIREVRK